MKGLLSYAWICLVLKVSLCFEKIKTPLKLNSQKPNIFLNKLEEDNYLIGSIEDNNFYRFESVENFTEISKNLKASGDGNECKYGVECPLIMRNSGEPTYRIIQYEDTKKIVAINLKEPQKQYYINCYDRHGVYSFKQIDDKKFVGLFTNDYLVRDRIIRLYEIDEVGGTIKNILNSTTLNFYSAGFLPLKNNEKIIFIGYINQNIDNSWSDWKVTVKFLLHNLTEAGENTFNMKLSGLVENITIYPFMYLTELNENKIIACYRNEKSSLSCFSGSYEENNFSFNNNKEIDKTKSTPFKIVQLNKDYALISSDLWYVQIDYDLNIINYFDLKDCVSCTDQYKSYWIGDFLAFNDYRFLYLIGLSKSGRDTCERSSNDCASTHLVSYQIPDCTNVELYLKPSESYPLKTLLLPNNSENAQDINIKINKTTENEFSISNGEGLINYEKVYNIESLKISGENSLATNFSFKLYESNIGFAYEKWCNASLIFCYKSCESCSQVGNDKNHSCDTCINNHHKVFSLDGNIKCLEKGSIGENYYKKENEYHECHERCKTCSKGGDDNNHNCDICKVDYFKNASDSTICEDNKNIVNYPRKYIDPDTRVLKDCYLTCEKCSKGGDDNNNNCEECFEGYVKVEGKEGKCSKKDDPKEELIGYYYDETESKLKQCHSNCTRCEGGGNQETSNCTVCKEGYVFTPEKKGNCISTEDRAENTYIDENNNLRYCHKNCKTCEGEGTDINNNCTKCIDDYFPLEDSLKTCMSKDGDTKNYYLDKEMFRKCHERCLSCSEGPNTELGYHKCKTCGEDYIFTSANNSGCCVLQEEITLSNEDVRRFLPIFGTPSTGRTRELIVQENYTFYYYSTDSYVQSDNISYIQLGDCESKLKKHYSLSEKERLLIALVLDNYKSSNMSYLVYDSLGEKKLDTSICSSVEVTFPLNKNSGESSLINSILSNKDLAKRVNLYDSKDSFYTNPCDIFEIDGEEISLEERQEMLAKDIQLCPVGCTLEDYSLYLNQVKCSCEPSEGMDESSFSSTFTVETNKLSLFKCYNMLSKFPGSSFVQWGLVGAVAVNTGTFIVMQFTLSKLMKSPLPSNPNTKKRKGEEIRAERWIEMTEPKSSKDLSFKKNKKDGKLDSEEEGFKEASSFGGEFCLLMKMKLIILSIFTNMNNNFLISMRLMLHLTTIAGIIFVNAILYKEKEFSIVNIALGFVIPFALYKIGYDVINGLCNSLKRIRVLSIVEFSITTLLSLVIWYYLFVFGIVYEKSQGKILLSSAISFCVFVAFQVCFSLLTAFVKRCGNIRNSKCLICLAKSLDILF